MSPDLKGALFRIRFVYPVIAIPLIIRLMSNSGRFGIWSSAIGWSLFIAMCIGIGLLLAMLIPAHRPINLKDRIAQIRSGKALIYD